ncbi:TIR domain-containing protein [Saccharothrix sp. HUAS TT1]|uniref:TIR domain-containing protein n=1 Tax=unclassified Saccharothrix TaxID=2593673 RepID=UPI00345BF6FC
MADGWDFFVSYTRDDRAWAEWIAWELEEAGHRVLVQAWDIVPGSNWVAAMQDGVRGAARTVAVLSSAYLGSVYGAAEWQAAWRDDPLGAERKLLVFRVEDCERPGLLGSVVSDDLFDLPVEEARGRLLAAARGGRRKPATAPGFPGTRAAREERRYPGGPARTSPAAGSSGSGGPAESSEPAGSGEPAGPGGVPRSGGVTGSGGVAGSGGFAAKTSGDPVTVLAVATEWASNRGGLSTFNRRLCTALAAEGARVFCTAPDASEQERQEAAAVGVTLVRPARAWRGPAHEAVARKPELPPGVVPDLVIGHGRITGHAADALLDHFPGARRVHFVHMAPDEIEWFKPDRDDVGVVAEQRHQEELDLGVGAHLVAAVGPRLFERYARDLSFDDTVPVVRVDPGFDVAEPGARRPPPGAPWSVLLFGRAEDAELKGLDIAARAVALAARDRGPNAAALELKVRGAPENSSARLRADLVRWADDPTARPLVRSYSTDSVALANDLRTASLVLVPSRAEGFGLTGVEAITAGTPVLVSAESGLGLLLRELLGPEVAARHVVPVTGSREDDAIVWKNAITATLRNREAAFEDAARLRDHLARERTWADAARALLAR